MRIFLLSFFLFLSAFADDYVQVTGSLVNIRTAPELNTTTVGKGTEGELFRYVGEEEDWFKVQCFSDRIRYIHKDFATLVHSEDLVSGHAPSLPAEISKTKSIYLEVKKATDGAKSMAEKFLPAEKDFDNFERLRTLILDRDVLKVFQENKLQPALYPDLLSMAEKYKW